MAVIRCKMCGGDMQATEGMTVAQCEYCGSNQTIPSADNEKKMTMFSRANRLRFGCEFDKAAGVYESIIADFPEEAEAYWGLVLCKYGIEYVDDPATAKKVPTCHRSSFESVMDDSNFDLALENADAVAHKVYRQEAKAIEELRKGIIEVSANEKPYDIFICYKETSDEGERTIDSVIAQDVYDTLTAKGYRVFFARITLEDRLGTEYEPYIFAALNSAKIMLAFGTSYDYYNAVWVKNEWSRFLQLMTSDKTKHLIPCYKGIDAYDIPKEFAKLQAQDMGKVGAVQDLLRGIEKLLHKGNDFAQPAAAVVQQVVQLNGGTVDSLLKRAFMYLEDGEWESADEYCEKVLDQDPENAEAYLGKLMAELQCHKREQLANSSGTFDNFMSYQKAIRFGCEELKKELDSYTKTIIYNKAARQMKSAQMDWEYKEAADIFLLIPDYKDSEKLAKQCLEKSEEVCNDSVYDYAVSLQNKGTAAACQKAIKVFRSIPGWRDADERVEKCRTRIEEIKAENEREAKKRKKIISIVTPIVAVCIVFIIVLNTVIIPNSKYNAVVALMDAGKYREAIAAFNALEEYKDSDTKILECIEKNGLQKNSLAAGSSHTVGLKSDGTVVAVGYNGASECDVFGWKDIVAVSAGSSHTVGLKFDGTVVAVGYNGASQCDVSGWKDIVAVSAGSSNTVGLKSDGTVVAVGYNGASQCNVSNWKDIVAVSAGSFHTVGLKSDGTVVAVGSNTYGQCDVSGWKDIVAVSAGISHTVGLKSDGTVVAVGYNGAGQCNVSGWIDIVAVSSGSSHTVGLKYDGTMVVVGANGNGQCDVSGWMDIVAISTGGTYSVGLKSDGTVVAVGNNDNGQCNVSDWSDIVTSFKASTSQPTK